MSLLASSPTVPGQLAIARPKALGLARSAYRLDLLLLGLVLLSGGLLRAAFALRAPVFIIPDSDKYYFPGFQLAHGLGFDLAARRTPLYPAFIAAVAAGIGQDLAALALAQHVLGLLTVGLTYWLGRVTFGRTAGLLAGLMTGLNGSLLISEQTVTTEALFTWLLVIDALIAVLALRGGPSWLFPLAGAVLGLAALARPVGLALFPGLPLALLATRPGQRKWARHSALFAAGFALLLLPWMARNYLTLHVFSTEGAIGQSLVGRTVRHDRFVFVDPRATPDPDTARQRARELMQEAANRGGFITPLRRRLMQEQGLSELEANQLMRDLAVEAILRQPGYFALGTARFLGALSLGWPERLRDAWESRRDPSAREEWESRPEIAGLLGPPSPVQERQFAQAEKLALFYQPGRFGAPLLAFFLLGLIGAAARPTWRPALLPGLWAVALMAVGVAFVGPVLRYRYPAEPFLAVLAAGGLTVLVACARSVLGRDRVRTGFRSLIAS